MSPANMACVILASGLSERFGEEDKLSADLHGQSVLSHVLDIAFAVGFGEVFVVSRTRCEDIFTWVKNEEPEAGQGHALRLGLRQARAADWQSCVILLGDMPLVSVSHVKSVIKKSEFKQSVVSISQSVRMPPTVFQGAAIDTILSQNSNTGARNMFDHLNLVTVPLDVNAALDVDTPEDLARVARIMETREK